MTRAEAEAKIIAGEYEDVLDAVERGNRDAAEKDGWWKEAVRCLDRAEKAERIVAVVKKFTVDNGSSLSVLQTMATLSRVIEIEEGKC